MHLKLPARTCFIGGPVRCGKSVVISSVISSHVRFTPDGEKLLLLASGEEVDNLFSYMENPKAVYDDPRLMIVNPTDPNAMRGQSPKNISTVIIANHSVLDKGTTVRYYESWSAAALHFMAKLDDNAALFPYVIAVTHMSDGTVEHPANRA